MNFKRYVEASDTWVDSHYIKKTDTDTITTLPAIIYSLAQTATIGLKGNTVQSGTPSPDSPIMPQGTGERTGNLLDVDSWYRDYKQPDGTYQATRSQLYAIKIKPFTSDDIGKTFTFAMNIAPVSGNVRVIANNGGTVTNGNSAARSVVTFTVASVDDTIYFNYGSSGDTTTTISNIMLNFGSTAKTYEPYGYKIPISINNVVTDIYIGDNPLRKSLDGTAYDTLAADGTLTRRVDSDGSVLPTPIVTQVTMPTFTTTPGANTLDVLTTVPPSEVTATFNGWHPVSSAHERDNGAWT